MQPIPLEKTESEGRGKPLLREPETPLLTVIIAAYNESRTIDELLHRVLATPYAKQVILVDDGSTDGTAEILKKWEGHPGVEIITHPRNLGKGTAIRTALDRARGCFTVIQDADLECIPEDYPALVEPLLLGQSRVVYGSRYLGAPRRTAQPWLNRVAVVLLNYFTRLLYGVRLTDEATCFKVLPTDVLRSMKLECVRFEFCAEVTAKTCRLGLSIREVPVQYFPRSVRAGKKIRWTDGVQAFATLWKYRNWRREPASEVVGSR